MKHDENREWNFYDEENNIEDDQHEMSASTLNLGQKQKDYEALQKLKWVQQIV